MNQNVLILEVYTHFSDSWSAGTEPDIGMFLHDILEPSRAKLFRWLLKEDLDCRRARDNYPSASAYSQRFPEYAAVIEELFGESEDTRAVNVAGEANSVAATVTSPEHSHPSIPGYEILDEL